MFMRQLGSDWKECVGAQPRRALILAQRAVPHMRHRHGRYNRKMSDTASRTLLGGLTPAAFLHHCWQKRALLVHQAIPDFRGCLSPSELFALAGRDDVESRIVLRERMRWSVLPGPFRRSALKTLPARGWTLLVHGVNLHSLSGDALLRRFGFIPYARLDDLMVSYAAPGGGVGPHFDSYDVFLLQGEGRRRWRISRQPKLLLRRGVPLKILARFRPSATSTLGPGDMLYLPPNHAHDGVALDACMTYSIGFRAPSAQELGTAFLDWLRDGLALEGRYGDPELAVAREPARIGAAMRASCAAMLAPIRWNGAAVARFVGCYLTEPKPQVYFDPPRRPPSLPRFAGVAARRGLRLDPRTQMLYDGHNVYVNGTALAWPACGGVALRRLANARRIRGVEVSSAALVRLLHGWYCDGFLDFE
jgi:50S ribosomal protein L16 3-hydroxylase